MAAAPQPGIDSTLWVARSPGEAAPWLTALAAAGLEAVGALPLVARQACSLSAAQHALLAGLGTEDVLFLTSAGAVELLVADKSLLPALAICTIAVVGPSTAEALRRPQDPWPGREPDLIANPANGASLAHAFLRLEPRPSGELVFFGAAHPHPELGEILAASGLSLTRIAAYSVEALPGLQPASGDVVLLFSPSSAHSLAQRVDGPEHFPVLAIGPTTAAAARQCGFPVLDTLPRPTPEALLECLARR